MTKLILYMHGCIIKKIMLLNLVPLMHTLNRLEGALDDYWGMTEQSLTRDTLRGFPSTIIVDQAVATWKFVADYKAK